ncbi:hypothetical protein [Aureimonas glaciei]|uniref:Uncharacterized protein n=1 Tax=Aureimonas glaciei TaxID=1776957 RepID=A0A917DJN1_9HYPH|nr:hypothetical protein [Aureimonas glaciei]GGD43856.1 hypothetical protein GCM10011335_53100 [Aureimonas glaciei]
MADEELMPTPVPRFRSRFEKRRQAGYSAKHREQHADVPVMRVVDRVIVEALGLHLQTLPPEVVSSLAPAISMLAINGLEFAGYDKKASSKAVGKRLLYLMSTNPRGLVRAARHRAAVRQKDLTAEDGKSQTPPLSDQCAEDGSPAHNRPTQTRDTA